jgi:hypothetical protein
MKTESRLLTEGEVLDILTSEEGSRTIGLRYGVSHSCIVKIRKGLTYREVYARHHAMPDEEKMALRDMPLSEYAKAYYYQDARYLRISVDDILITLDMASKKAIDIRFNTHIRGKRIDYFSALALLRENSML